MKVAGEDLTRRRREYRTRLDEWLAREREREEVLRRQALIEEARELLNGSAIKVHGRLERHGRVTNVIAERIERLDIGLAVASRDFR